MKGRLARRIRGSWNCEKALKGATVSRAAQETRYVSGRPRMPWWEYYEFGAQPSLDATAPLVKSEDFDLFWGRAKEIETLQSHADTETKTCQLIIGDAGMGKTSLQCKAFQEDRGFVRVNLSKARSAEKADCEIASALVNHLKEKGIKISDLERRLDRSVSHTTGRVLHASPEGVGASSVNQTTETLDWDLAIEAIIRETLSRLSSKYKRVVLALDESDFLGDSDATELCRLCQRVKDMLPEPGILILANRDVNGVFWKDFSETRSLVRATFDNLHRLSSLWKPGEGNVKEFLVPRFKRGKLPSASRFPLSDRLCYWLDILSHGNIREVLRYTKHVLMRGAGRESIPLSDKFAIQCLLQDFPELGVEDEEDRNILAFLARTPSSMSDKKFIKIAGSRSTLQRRLENLEKKMFVERDSRVQGKRQIYRITKKTEILGIKAR
ncbi:MAG: AAA family ATPase [Candidatus Sumerlaeota bacterium]|nr:AAA family ATPase [Candidatus Sumerlaeota bacterium]